jgi:hypothetical protein
MPWCRTADRRVSCERLADIALARRDPLAAEERSRGALYVGREAGDSWSLVMG